jgi:hypothetical protein
MYSPLEKYISYKGYAAALLHPQPTHYLQRGLNNAQDTKIMPTLKSVLLWF